MLSSWCFDFGSSLVLLTPFYSSSHSFCFVWYADSFVLTNSSVYYFIGVFNLCKWYCAVTPCCSRFFHSTLFLRPSYMSASIDCSWPQQCCTLCVLQFLPVLSLSGGHPAASHFSPQQTMLWWKSWFTPLMDLCENFFGINSGVELPVTGMHNVYPIVLLYKFAL